jgi:hypothetical protein
LSLSIPAPSTHQKADAGIGFGLNPHPLQNQQKQFFSRGVHDQTIYVLIFGIDGHVFRTRDIYMQYARICGSHHQSHEIY